MRGKMSGLLLVAVAIGAVGGCGGSGATLTKDQLSARARVVCERAEDQARARYGRGDLTSVTQRMATILRLKANGMAALTPPKELASRFEAYVHVLRAQSALFTKYATALRSGVRLTPTTKGQELKTREEELAIALRFKGCIERVEAFESERSGS